MTQDDARPAGDLPPSDELALLRDVVEVMPVMMIAVEGPELRVVAVSGAIQAVNARSQWQGRPLGEVYPELAAQGVLGIYDEVVRTGRPFLAPEWRVEVTGQNGEATAELVINWTCAPWLWPDGSLRGAIGVAHDVTAQVMARRQAEAEAAESGRQYQRTRDLVGELQRALLPSAVPVLPQVDLAARYLVAGVDQSAGGDWFDVRPLPDGRVGLAVGDVVGHGVAAAAVMSQLRAVLGDALATTGSPDAAAARLERFAETLPGARSATVVVAVLDPTAGSLEYVTRGHPAPLLVDAAGEGRHLLGSGGGPLGSGSRGTLRRSELAEGDVVVLFSDGLVERSDRPYAAGLDELTRLAETATTGQLWPTGTSPSAVDRICTDAVELLTRRGYDDDVTVLAAALQPAVPGFSTRLRPSAGELPRVRAELHDWLTALRLSANDHLAIELAVGEAVDNAVEHGFRDLSTGTVVLAVRLLADGRVHVRVDDDGIWRPPSLGRGRGRGRGLELLASLGDDLSVDRRPTGTTVTFARRVSRTVGAAPARVAVPDQPLDGESYGTVLGGEPLVLQVHGAVDALAGDRFRTELVAAAQASSSSLTVDLTGVSHLTSIGVAALVELLQGADEERPVELVAPTGSPAAFVLDLVGLPRRPAAGGPPA
ncbi:SpoIIE family protein phosphatase [Modestobacter marinus]|uniref:SpoIIE family protein phosphatase n=1 Tax=Modestobacter marinus TaxID=477641 RepID=UPI00201A2BA9|nr:SpoIIE family protein phosphatase [Modestobacter marinus]